MLIKNTTIQNRSKRARLDSQHIIPTHGIMNKQVVPFLESLMKLDAPKEIILFSIGRKLAGENPNPYFQEFLAEYKYLDIIIPEPPSEQFDLLGIAYQYLSSKSENLERGSFYTGYNMARDFVKDLSFKQNETILDPSCGSGAFLFSSDASPNQIYGVDADPLAIMIAKFNYFIKFPSAQTPNLFCEDFFRWFDRNSKSRFDYIIGNPPYGANVDISKLGSLHVTSGESFSYFIEYGFCLMKSDGLLRFLLPESLLNIKRHTDIRDFILNHTNLTRVKRYQSRFAGLMSDVYLLELRKGETTSVLFEDKETTNIPVDIFQDLKNHIIVHLTDSDISILSKVMKRKSHDLSNSLFGLGVVTGDNKSKLFREPTKGSEPIITGKEVQKYRLLEPKNYIVFDRENLQQVAPDSLYRAPEKLVYKVINRHLRVAIDTESRLTTNSANLFIPKIEGLNAICVMALLNSDLYSYLHLKLFGGVNKIAKENLMSLPFPELTSEQSGQLEALTRQVIQDGDDIYLQKYIHKDIFDLKDEEVSYIQGRLV